MRHLASVVGLALGLSACGARTGLRVDLDAGAMAPTVDAADVLDARDVVDAFDSVDVVDAVDARDVVDVPEVCVEQRVSVFARESEVMLVLDRSQSMNQDLTGGTGVPTRWTTLRQSLGQVLPRYEARISTGLLFFPSTSIAGDGCVADGAPAIAPARNNAGSILARLNAAQPGGRTPTWDAVRNAAAFMRGRARPGLAQAMVLATDGAPNCNGALEVSRCVCTSLGPPPPMCSDVLLCLDSDRTAMELSRLAAQGIPTYVIGIDGDMRPELVAVLDVLARAGGRPNTAPGARAYYPVLSQADLSRAFDAVQGALSQCVLRATRRPVDGVPVELELDGAAVPRDPTRRDGWDWTDEGEGSLEIYGPACARSRPGSSASLRLLCTDAGR